MKQIWIIANRELKTFFDSIIAYVILVIFLGFTGFFTWIFGQDIFMQGEANTIRTSRDGHQHFLKGLLSSVSRTSRTL